MRKTYIAIALTITLVFGAFIAGFFLFQKMDAEKLVPLDWPFECPPDTRMAQTAWMTYVSRDLGFSVEYPEVLAPMSQNSISSVIFRTKTESSSNILLGADINIDVTPAAENKGVSGINEYRCSPIKFGGAARTSANIYHNSKVYRLTVVGMSFNDAERMINSIKFLE